MLRFGEFIRASLVIERIGDCPFARACDETERAFKRRCIDPGHGATQVQHFLDVSAAGIDDTSDAGNVPDRPPLDLIVRLSAKVTGFGASGTALAGPPPLNAALQRIAAAKTA